VFVELFANLGMHGYICEREPASLPALETFFEVIWRTSPTRWPITDLHRMHEAATAADADGTNGTRRRSRAGPALLNADRTSPRTSRPATGAPRS
jgi:hypothetical protein